MTNGEDDEEIVPIGVDPVRNEASFFTDIPVGTKVWERLEALTRNAELSESVRAEVRDPAWMLGRQWQVGEFTLEDAGSPVDAEVRIEHDELSKVALGNGDPVEYDRFSDGPLEALVERESVATELAEEPDSTPNTRLQAEAGQHFLRLLESAGVTRADGEPYTATDFPDDGGEKPSLSLQAPEDEKHLDAEAKRYVSLLAGGDDARVLDGTEVFRRISDREPPLPGEMETVTESYRDAAEAYVEWYTDLYEEPTESREQTWDAQRFEYSFNVATGDADTETVLSASEYAGGRLDRDSFSVDGETSLDPSADRTHTSEPRTVNRLPTPISFHGMPASRWWEFEDAEVNIDDLSAAPEGLPRLAVLEFALIYGNDWFTIPVGETPVGSLSRITHVSVTDCFGVTAGEKLDAVEGEAESIPVADGDWKAFMVDIDESEATAAGESEKGLFLPPTVTDVEQSDPVERVYLARDEMANLAFGIERLVEGPAGLTLNLEEHHPPELAVQSIRPAEEPAQDHVVLENVGSMVLDAEGWSIASEPAGDAAESPAPFTFGDRSIPPGGSVTVASGSAPSRSAEGEADVFWGRDDPVWTAGGHLVLDDPEGNSVERVRVPPQEGSLLPAFRLATDVPDNWYPLKPTGPDAVPDKQYMFRLAKMVDAEELDANIFEMLGDGSAMPEDVLEPDFSGEILEDSRKELIYEEEVTRAGVELRRSYQLASWIDGSRYLWAGRRAATGRGEGRSGLQFDVLEE